MGALGQMSRPKSACLNFVNVWSSPTTKHLVWGPLLLSVPCCILWPAVAVVALGADVQTSIQTAVTIAGFVVTASE